MIFDASLVIPSFTIYIILNAAYNLTNQIGMLVDNVYYKDFKSFGVQDL